MLTRAPSFSSQESCVPEFPELNGRKTRWRDFADGQANTVDANKSFVQDIFHQLTIPTLNQIWRLFSEVNIFATSAVVII